MRNVYVTHSETQRFVAVGASNLFSYWQFNNTKTNDDADDSQCVFVCLLLQTRTPVKRQEATNCCKLLTAARLGGNASLSCGDDNVKDL